MILSDPLTHVWFTMCLRWISRPPISMPHRISKRAFRESSDDLLKNAPAVSHNNSHQSFLFQIFSSFSHQNFVVYQYQLRFYSCTKSDRLKFSQKGLLILRPSSISSDSFNCISVSFLLVIHSHFCCEPRYLVFF